MRAVFNWTCIIRALAMISCLHMLAPFVLAEVRADRIVLENNDTIHGKIIRLKDGILTVETNYSDVMKIKWASIKEVETTEPLSVHLASGDVLKGRLVTDAEGNLISVASEGRDSTMIAWDAIEAINPPPVTWTANITAGGTAQTGNSDTSSASIAAEGVRRSKKERYSIKFMFNYSDDADRVTTRNTYGTLKYDYFYAVQFYNYLSIEMLNDTFKDIRLRTVVGPGTGYQVWDDKNKALFFELGVVYFNENRDEAEDDDWIAARASSSFRVNIADILTFSEAVTAYMKLEDQDDYQIRNEASIRSALSSSWALKLTNIIDYDNKPSADTERTDVYWILGLQYSI